MGKKVVILNGSPRKKGNTSALAAEFTRGAEEAGHIVTEFFLDSIDIHGCKGCFGGHSSKEFIYVGEPVPELNEQEHAACLGMNIKHCRIAMDYGRLVLI